ncbi:hypothetical protein KAH81_00830 [bacterium]|nr:hypothetical protein [bacterium]
MSRKFKLDYLWIIPLFALVSFSAFAQDGSAGQAGELLRSGLDARSFSMGRAYTVMPTGGDALVWNPAGLGKLGRWEFRFMHAQGYVDSRTEYGSFAIPIGDLGGFGIGFANEGVTSIEGRDAFNRSTEEISWGESAALFGWGRAFMQNKLYGGLTAKYVMQNMGDESANGFGGVDVGFLSKEFMFKYRVGLTLQNLGAAEVAGDAYPMTVRAGVGWRVLNDLYVTADGEMVSGRDISPRVGAEYHLGWVAIRAGYDIMKPELTFGLGLMIDNIAGRVAGTYPRLDYAGGALAPIGNNFARVSLTLMGEEMSKLEDIEGDPCSQLSTIEPHMSKRGFVGAKANLIYGECRFKAEALEAPFDIEPRFGEIHPFFNSAYYGKYGSNWMTEIVTDTLAQTVFSQKTHYMYAETRMAKGIDEEAKILLDQLISAGGDSAQYDLRLQYDLALINEELGETDAALKDYESIAGKNVDDPVKVLALYRAANILRDRDKTKAINYLETLVSKYGSGFYDESGERIGYPMFPKYMDNSIADDATILLADIIFSTASGDPTVLRKALGLYLDVLIYYPDMQASIRREAAEKAAICFEELGDSASAASMRSKAGEI